MESCRSFKVFIMSAYDFVSKLNVDTTNNSNVIRMQQVFKVAKCRIIAVTVVDI